ncbi:hypothetical protein, partial [Dactylosporangium sp. NPDC005555]|uniref:hypothetical protein n=1 Tax=Dactylosporangium sp. NPDC005555 TaxID=3154889 RepID=UPI0033BAFE62
PGQETAVAGGGGGEGGVGELGAEGGDDRGDVGVFVGVNAEDDLLRFRFRVGLSGGLCTGPSTRTARL